MIGLSLFVDGIFDGSSMFKSYYCSKINILYVQLIIEWISRPFADYRAISINL